MIIRSVGPGKSFSLFTALRTHSAPLSGLARSQPENRSFKTKYTFFSTLEDQPAFCLTVALAFTLISQK